MMSKNTNSVEKIIIRVDHMRENCILNARQQVPGLKSSRVKHLLYSSRYIALLINLSTGTVKAK